MGIGISTVLLPILSKHFENKEHQAIHEIQNRVWEFALFLTLPAAFALIAMAQPIISVIFERSEFTSSDARETAMVLMAYACGLPAYILIKISSTTFFAQYNTKTPVKTAIVSMLINIVLTILLMQPFQHVGVAAATALTAWLNAGILSYYLFRQGALIIDHRLRQRLPKIVLAATIMAITIFYLSQIFDFKSTEILIKRCFSLAFIIVIGMAIYFGCTYIFGGVKIREMKTLLKIK